VARYIRKDPQRLVRIVRTVEQQPGAEPDRPVVGRGQLALRRDGQVQMHLLRHGAIGPGRPRHMRHVLERQPLGATVVEQHQPILRCRVRLTRRRRLVPWPVAEGEQPAVELGQATGVGAVEDDLSQYGNPGGAVHTALSLSLLPACP
jgi:hypothetical protein